MGFYNILEHTVHEHLYESACLSEGNWLMGTTVQFYPCIVYRRDISDDPHPKWENPVELNIVFDSNPKPVLRKLNWLADDEKQLPYIAYISNIIYPKFREFKRQYSKLNKSIKKYFDTAFNSDGTPSQSNSFYVPVRRYSKIVLLYNMEVIGKQKFVITDISGDTLNPFIWICKLAPYREQVDMIPETSRIEPKISPKQNDAISGHSFLKGVKY